MKRVFAALLIFAIPLALLLPLAGCGGNARKPSAPASNPAASAPTTPPDTGSDELDEYQDPEVKAAVAASLRYAEDANAASKFKVKDFRVVSGWARVAVEETGVPAEEVVGFDIYLKKQEDGEWEVVETGTGITPEHLPGAPSEIFDSD